MSERKPLRGEDLTGELYDMHDVMAETGYSRTTIYVRIAHGDFPPPRTLGRSLFWPAAEVQEWVAKNPRTGRGPDHSARRVRRAAAKAE